jgi:hypothetical protein
MVNALAAQLGLDLALAWAGDGAVRVDGREAPVDGPPACALFHLGTRGENVGAAPGARLAGAVRRRPLTLGTHMYVCVCFAAASVAAHRDA